jgi:SSS family solute:Na+ symporter
MTLLPAGFKGLVFAALLAAIVSSLASMSNSISTLFTMDLLPRIYPRSSNWNPVRVGRAAAIIAMLVAMASARPLLGSFDQAFQYIQEFTGFFTPGIVAIFLLGMFWPRTTAAGALAAALGSVLLSLLLKLLWPALPFIDRVGVVFLAATALAVAVSLIFARSAPKQLEIADIDFSTSATFNLSATMVTLIIAALYAVWW